MIAAADRLALLDIARHAIGASLGVDPPERSPVHSGLTQHAGVFVTLHVDGQLRGCIGHLDADRPIASVVASCAVSAATADPRFPALRAGELDTLAIEISVLGGFDPVQRLADIDVGRHGLLAENGWRRGLLLPQVATQWGWDAATFVAQTCRKAGLPSDAWPDRGASLYRFEAEVFGG